MLLPALRPSLEPALRAPIQAGQQQAGPVLPPPTFHILNEVGDKLTTASGDRLVWS